MNTSEEDNVIDWMKFEDAVSEIAAALTADPGIEGAWTTEFPDSKGYLVNAWLDGPDGARVALSLDTATGRTKLRPIWPTGGADYAPELPTVSLKIDKLGAAADLWVRFLKPYLEALDVVRAGLDEQAADERRRAALLTRLKGAGSYEAAGQTRSVLSTSAGREGYLSFVGTNAWGYGEARINNNGTGADLNLRNLPADAAVAVLETLARYAETEV